MAKGGKSTFMMDSSNNTSGSAAPSVLIVDDEATDRMLLSALVERLLPGTQVEVAESVESCQALLAEQPQPYQVIFLDMVLPDGGGDDLGEALHNHSPDAIVIISSGLELEALGAKTAALEFDDYIRKPIDPVMVRQVVSNCLTTIARQS